MLALLLLACENPKVGARDPDARDVPEPPVLYDLDTVAGACAQFTEELRSCYVDGCGPDAECKALVDEVYPAANACDDEGDLAGDEAEEARQLYLCYLGAIVAGDCHTDDGYAAIAEDLAACIGT